MSQQEAGKGCDYQGHEFGASYLDSICIDGYLWDADSGSDTEHLTSGGDIPCPQCNHAAWLANNRDEIEDQGYFAAEEGKPRECPIDATKMKYPDDYQTVKEWWLDGYHKFFLDRVEGLQAKNEKISAESEKCVSERNDMSLRFTDLMDKIKQMHTRFAENCQLDDHLAFQELLKAIDQVPSNTCVWTQTDDIDYETACGRSLSLESPPASFNYLFCSFCGKRLEHVVEPDH